MWEQCCHPQKDSCSYTRSLFEAPTLLCFHKPPCSPVVCQTFNQCASTHTSHRKVLRFFLSPPVISKHIIFPCPATKNTYSSSIHPCTHPFPAIYAHYTQLGSSCRERDPPFLKPVQPPSSHNHDPYTQTETQTPIPQKQSAPNLDKYEQIEWKKWKVEKKDVHLKWWVKDERRRSWAAGFVFRCHSLNPRKGQKLIDVKVQGWATGKNQEGSNKEFGVLKDKKSNKIRLCRFISSDPSQSRLSSQGAGHQMLAELVKGT